MAKLELLHERCNNIKYDKKGGLEAAQFVQELEQKNVVICVKHVYQEVFIKTVNRVSHLLI